MLQGGSMKRLVIIFLFVMSISLCLFSDEYKIENLLNMTLEELLNVEIRTGTLTSKFSYLDLTLRRFARNLLQYNHIHYVIQYWETENLRQYPRQCGFIEEPHDISAEFSMEF